MGSLGEHVTTSTLEDRKLRYGGDSAEQKSTSGIVSLMDLVSVMCNKETSLGLRIALDLRILEAPNTA